MACKKYNKHRRTIPLLLILFGLLNGLHAQPVDSLVLKYTDERGMVNIDSLLVIGRNYLYQASDKALEIGQRSLDIAEKQGDRLKIAHCNRFLGVFYIDVKYDFDSALYYYGRAEQLYRAVDSKEGTEGEGAILHNYGAIKHFQGDYLGAIEYYTRALHLFDMTGEMQTRPITLNNLSVLYAFVKDTEKAEKYARECIGLCRQTGNAYMLANGNLALADALMTRGEYDLALPILDEALEIGERIDNIGIIFGCHFNYGNYYNYKKDYAQALREHLKAKEIALQLKNEWNILKTHIALSEIYLQTGQYDQANALAEYALPIAQKTATKDMQERALSLLARAAAHDVNFEEAYGHLAAAYLLRDTLFNEENQRHLAYLETEYQTEKKELRIGILEQQRKLYTWIGISGTIILLVVLAFFIIRYRLALSQRKLVEEEKQRLEQEKQLVAVQATLDGEAAERSRLAKDLHDGLGSMLSVVKFNLPQMQSGTVVGTIDVPRFQKALGMLDDSIQELRRVAHHMMPESLMRYGLKASLSDFCTAIPQVDFHYFGNEERLPEKLEILIYRCIHELVNNSLKHAKATHINVQLVQEEDRVSFTVQDDGEGFDQKAVTEGMGLQNIRQRVAAFRGKMSIYSSEQGTETHVELELNAGAE